MRNTNDTAVFLCDLTGNMGKPWMEAGYNIVLIDPQHPSGVNTEEHPAGNTTTRFGGVILEATAYLHSLIAGGRVAFVAGFPPCTDVSLSGTRWWDTKRKKDPYFQAKAAMVAEQCRMVGMLSGARWLFENPMSALSKMFGRPQYKFHPHHFTGLEPADNYRKETWLWTGGGFVMPDPVCDELLGDPDDRIHKAPPGRDRANFRSATPLGFARAVFFANAPEKVPGVDSED